MRPLGIMEPPQNTPTSPADEMWGWEFGCDGLMTVVGACRFLSISRDTLDRRILSGELRKGKKNGRVYVCERSVRQYAKRMEV